MDDKTPSRIMNNAPYCCYYLSILTFLLPIYFTLCFLTASHAGLEVVSYKCLLLLLLSRFSRVRLCATP